MTLKETPAARAGSARLAIPSWCARPSPANKVRAASEGGAAGRQALRRIVKQNGVRLTDIGRGNFQDQKARDWNSNNIWKSNTWIVCLCGR
jgi:hypothetical protein